MVAKKSRIQIIVDFLSDEEKTLLIGLCEEAGFSTDNVTVQPFERYGEKANKLLLVYFDSKKATLPFVVKIADKKDIQSELQAIKHISAYVDDATNTSYHDTGNLGALLYRHRGAQTAEGVRLSKEFEEVAYDLTVATDTLIGALQDVYSRLDTAHRAAQTKQIDLLEDENGYNWYLRDNRQSRIESILGELRTVHDKFEFLGAQIYNPIYAIQELPKILECKLGPVHGDLHPKNIILDATCERASLIDFAWSEYPKHILVDYTLLENSLRFMLFPRYCNLTEQLEVDRLLLDENGYENIHSVPFSTDVSKDYYSRLQSMLKQIRQCAKSVLGKDYNFTEYLISQFIILYGLLKIEKYHPYVTARALGLIAEKLFTEGVIQKK